MKKVFLTLVAAALIFSCKNKDEVAPADPKMNSYFKMEGELKDSTGKLSAEVIDITFTSGRAVFNGVTSYAKIPATGTIATPNKLSLSLAFKANYKDPSLKPRMLQMIDNQGNSIEIYIENSRVVLANWSESLDKNVVKIITPSSPDLLKWHKVDAIMDFEANTMSLYVDGQLVRTATGVTLAKPGDATVILGRHEHSNVAPMDYYLGELDNVSILETLPQ